MKYFLLILALLGITASALALREHYRESGDSPCSINDHWDCGVVNHSPFATLDGVLRPSATEPNPFLRKIPIATIGILGYIFMAALAFTRRYRLLLVAALAALAFSLYLAHIEKDILEVWCIYCVISLGIISLISLFTLGTVIGNARKPNQGAIG
jgi:vitamin-K-epoxide reductase (warfarin-sensitive)